MEGVREEENCPVSMGVGMAASSDLAADERTGLQEKQRILSAQIQQDREHAQALRAKISKTKEVGLVALRRSQMLAGYNRGAGCSTFGSSALVANGDAYLCMRG